MFMGTSNLTEVDVPFTFSPSTFRSPFPSLASLYALPLLSVSLPLAPFPLNGPSYRA